MVRYFLELRFEKSFKKIKSNALKNRVIKQIDKILDEPLIGKPMRSNRKGTREVYIKPFRLSYRFDENSKILTFLEIYHKDEQ